MKDKVYQFAITFNEQKITKIVITDHYQAKHSKVINDELILQILKDNLDGLESKPDLTYEEREVFVLVTKHKSKNYRLILWHDNQDKSILWIRNCYRID